MSLRFQPKQGSVVMCDFHGAVIPEITKKRPVVVISKHRHNGKLVTVIPLSTTKPTITANYHFKFLINPLNDIDIDCWAKCDMIYTVSIERLSLCRVKDNKNFSQRKVLEIDDESYKAIKKAVACALNILV